jgi:prepilin-type N-terminal cleavage/methylation domain-containing protein
VADKPQQQELMHRPNRKNQNGFTLIEILVALVLVSLMLFFALDIKITPRQKLEEALDKTERALRFAQDESVLRNAVVRVRINMDVIPQTISVEYGPSENFVMPVEPEEKLVKNKNEEEDLKKARDDLNKKFNRVPEIEEASLEIPEEVTLFALSNDIKKKLITKGEISLYSYPSGERDSGLLFFASVDEVVSLSMDSYAQTFERDYVIIEQNEKSVKEREENLIEMAQDIYKKWTLGGD